MSDLYPVIDLPADQDADRVDLRTREQRDPERGFSLIELIIVIVILGILVAIAIPVYNNIQNNAKTNAVKTAAANGASQAVAQVANGTAVASIDLSNLQSGDVKTVKVAKGSTADDICVEATDGGSNDWFSGPGAAAGGTACK